MRFLSVLARRLRRIDRQVNIASPWDEFLRFGTTRGSKPGIGTDGLLTLEDTEGWYREGTMTWGGGGTFKWFVDRKNDLCEVGAVQAAIPVDGMVVSELKDRYVSARLYNGRGMSGRLNSGIGKVL